MVMRGPMRECVVAGLLKCHRRNESLRRNANGTFYAGEESAKVRNGFYDHESSFVTFLQRKVRESS